MKRNNALPNNHFRKTAKRFRTWFEQPARALRRRNNRLAKAESNGPMPINKLRPVVRCTTIRYNRNERLGKGFTAEEVQAAGLDYRYARTIGISVDLRRQNRNEEAFNANVQRIKDYVSKLVFYDSRQQAKEQGAKSYLGEIMPVVRKTPIVKAINVSEIANFSN
jgi:large subunit ribosomal protein L13e